MAEARMPTNAALIEKLRMMRGGAPGALPGRPTSPLPGGGAPAPGMGPDVVGDMSQPVGNPVAFHLMQALKYLVEGGPDNEENKAALEMFMMSLVKVFDTSGLQGASLGQAPESMMGQPTGAPTGAPMAPTMAGPPRQTR